MMKPIDPPMHIAGAAAEMEYTMTEPKLIASFFSSMRVLAFLFEGIG
jgi:hypothetical protein